MNIVGLPERCSGWGWTPSEVAWTPRPVADFSAYKLGRV